MSTTTAPAPPARRADRARHARRADRPPRALHRHALSHGALGWVVVAVVLGFFAPRVETRSVRRGLGSERLAVGAGPQADRTRLRRPRQLRADDRRLFPDADGRLPGVLLGHSPRRTDAAGERRGAHGRGPGARTVDLPRRPHRDRAGGRRAEPQRNGRRRRQAQGNAARALDGHGGRQPHRRRRDVV